MSRRLDKGIELLREVTGSGMVAGKGCQVVYNARMFLRKGDEVTQDARSIAAYRDHLTTRMVEGVELIDHTTTLGKRRPIAAVEKSLFGMQPGAHREVQASAHLCYGERGIEGLIPPHAMLKIQLWVRDVQPPADAEEPWL